MSNNSARTICQAFFKAASKKTELPATVLIRNNHTELHVERQEGDEDSFSRLMAGLKLVGAYVLEKEPHAKPKIIFVSGSPEQLSDKIIVSIKKHIPEAVIDDAIAAFFNPTPV